MLAKEPRSHQVAFTEGAAARAIPSGLCVLMSDGRQQRDKGLRHIRLSHLVSGLRDSGNASVVGARLARLETAVDRFRHVLLDTFEMSSHISEETRGGHREEEGLLLLVMGRGCLP